MRCFSYSWWGLFNIYCLVKMKSLLIVQIVFSIFVTSPAQNDNHYNSNRTAPNFKLENLDGEIIELNNYLGDGPILLCFWSSCCKSAVAQVEAFSKLYKTFREEGLMMLAIATDDEKTVAKVKPYAKSKKYEFQVLYDTDGEVARIYYALDNPYGVLINNQGRIVYTHLGYMKGDEINVDKIIRNLLCE